MLSYNVSNRSMLCPKEETVELGTNIENGDDIFRAKISSHTRSMKANIQIHRQMIGVPSYPFSIGVGPVGYKAVFGMIEQNPGGFKNMCG